MWLVLLFYGRTGVTAYEVINKDSLHKQLS